MRRLANRTIAVLDGITREVRLLGEGGELRLSLRGRGRGPGELVSPGILSRHSPYEGPDSLGVLLFDPGLSGLSWVSVGGSVASETFPPRGDLGGVVVYVGGRLLTRRRSTPSSFDPGIDQTGPEASLLVDPWTAAVRTVAEVEVPRTFNFFSSGSLVGLRFPFEVSSAVAVGRDRFWIVGERRSEVWEYDREGQLRRVLRIAGGPRKATRRDLDLFIDVMQRSVSTREAAALWDREIRGLPWMGRLSAFDTLVLDDAGLLWARRYAVDPDAPRPWVVFGEGGRALGTVTLPSGLSVAQIGHDFVLGMWRDTMGVRLVRCHALLRAPSQAEGFPSPPSPPTPQRGPAPRIRSGRALGEAAGVLGTPTVWLNGRLFAGRSLTDFRQAGRDLMRPGG